LVLLYLAAWAGILYLVILAVQDNERVWLILILVAFALIVLLFIPYLDRVAKRVFSFPGEGEPIPIAELRDLIESVNSFVDAPVIVQEREHPLTGQRALVVTWKYVDARWWEALSRAGLSQLYELHVKLDGERHRATLVDVLKSVDWRAGPGEVRLRGGYFRGIRENWELGTVYDDRFVSSEIKLPVMNSILRSGWNVRFGMW